ncbi:GNAT family N-acetyltransferase [Radiobacillus kanasensis]|uniref:GNAT family N-acetyltransferase n=1 Tax=Radiobacillus kanasensis TaxID=2844358 RepID=UPI001E52725C|nr:GNAT family N-acetyltransferase [Radiobacillus kanasensis]UFT99700.1 GNAT family N-acetyltransferase [Radiobacillus kanasensis]
MIHTKRLTLIPFTKELITATIMGKSELEALLEVKVSAEWPNPDYEEILPFIEEQLTNNPEFSKWSYLIVHNQTQMIVGEIGCKGSPDENGSVEIGYGVVPFYQKKGIASEAVSGFVNWLRTEPKVGKILAECLPENIGSIRVLEKSGFVRIKTGPDMIYWEQ